MEDASKGYELKQERSIHDLEKDVLASLASCQPDAKEGQPAISHSRDALPQKRIQSLPSLEAATAATAAGRSRISVRQSYPPPAWDDAQFQRAGSFWTASDDTPVADHSQALPSQPLSLQQQQQQQQHIKMASVKTTVPPRRVSSSNELSSLAQLTKSGARRSAPASGWTPNPDSALTAATIIRSGDVSAIAQPSSIEDNITHSPKKDTASQQPSFRGVIMASVRNFFSPDNRVDVTPVFPHMFRQSTRDIQFNFDQDEEEEEKDLARFRLVKRNLPHFQSMNQVDIQQRTHSSPCPSNHDHSWLPSHWLPTHWALYQRDWFHILLRWNTFLSILFWSFIWTCSLLIFALIYLAASHSSNNKICYLANGFTFDFTAAFAFSLETAMTVGYTLPVGKTFILLHHNESIYVWDIYIPIHTTLSYFFFFLL